MGPSLIAERSKSLPHFPSQAPVPRLPLKAWMGRPGLGKVVSTEGWLCSNTMSKRLVENPRLSRLPWLNTFAVSFVMLSSKLRSFHLTWFMSLFSSETDSSRPVLTIQEAAQSASLVVASLYPIIDLHREDFHRKYNFPSDNEIGEAKAANWDSRVLMVGEKERGERMARERDGQGSATHVLGLERNETNSSANTQVV